MTRAKGLAAVFIAVFVAVLTAGSWRPAVAPYLAIIGRAFGLAGDEGRLLGYLEADTTLVAAPVAGRLARRDVARGTDVVKGAPLFALDTVEADAVIARLRAQRDAAAARLADASAGQRPEEKAVLSAQQDEARAALAFAEQDLARQRELQSRSVAAKATYDQAVSQVAQLQAKIAALAAQEHVGDLGGREAALAALAADRDAAAAALAEAEHRRVDMAPVAPAAGHVEDTYYNPGEWVPAGLPVVALIAEGGLKLRFFVPEAEVATVRPGSRVAFRCDSCPANQTAVVDRVASKPEYTPPVIYSTGARAKLVFLVEARPEAGAARLPPGLPVEVTLSPDARP
jgi:HlyD family secretion protein